MLKKIMCVSLVLVLVIGVSVPTYANNTLKNNQSYFYINESNYDLDNPQVIYIKKKNGNIYYNPSVNLNGPEKDKFINNKEKYNDANLLGINKVNSDQNFSIEYIPDPEEGDMRIIYGQASTGSWIVVDDLNKTVWDTFKSLVLAGISAIINPVGGLIIGLGDAVIDAAVQDANQVSSAQQTNYRVMKKIVEVYDGSCWISQSEFQRWEKYWQMHTYTYDSMGEETNDFKYTSYPGASGAVIMPEIPIEAQEHEYYSNDTQMFNLTYELYINGYNYAVYEYDTFGYNITEDNTSYWDNYIESNSVPVD